MKKVHLLDCTLRDGGYINNWDFGEAAIVDIKNKLEESKVDILEIGFLKDEPYERNRTVFNSVEQMAGIIGAKNPNTLYTAMIEVVNPLPLSKLTPCSSDTVDVVRVVIWKKFLEEGFKYCEEIVNKGYKLCVQPARVDQYSSDEFIAMVKKFNALSPLATYVVDSFGTQDKESLFKYIHMANEYLNSTTALGYHGHNNLQQVMGLAQLLVEAQFDRSIFIDASVYGIGRGAGNLNLELIMKYLNERHGTSYSIPPLFDIFDAYLEPIYAKMPWGYSFGYFLAAQYGCNPNYVDFFIQDHNISTQQLKGVFDQLSETEKIIFTPETAHKYLTTCRQ